MRVEQALAKIGVSIADASDDDGTMTLMLRIQGDPTTQRRWRKTLERFLLAEEKGRAQWQADVSKHFFAKAGAVRFLWRLVFTGNVKTASRVLRDCALESLKDGVEVTSLPLVGRVNYEFDPTKGKFKGAHDIGVGAKALAAIANAPGGIA